MIAQNSLIFSKLLLGALALSCLSACSDASADEPGPAAGSERFPMMSVVFGDDTSSTYVNVLPSLSAQEIDYEQAREFAGWTDLWVVDDKVFVADGESPLLTRYHVDDRGDLIEERQISFQGYGAAQAAFWAHLFIDRQKAYWFDTNARKAVIWDPSDLEIIGSFDLPELPNRAGQILVGPTADRSSVVRDGRAYVPFYWADWENYALSDDSVILVVDTETDQVIDAISVPCPELNFATVDDEQNIYFSSWGFSAIPTLLDGLARACAVRMPAGSDELDPDWSLTFADVTEGREASSLRWLNDGKALLTVLHHERLTLSPDADRFALTDSANWRLWMLDLGTLTAEPLDSLGWHAPGLYGTRIDGETLLSVPSADYASSTTYRFGDDGSAEPLWRATGWQTRLFKLGAR